MIYGNISLINIKKLFTYKNDRILNTLLEWLLPYCCVLCSDKTDTGLDLCRSCINDLPWLSNTCPKCALPMDSNHVKDSLCGNCLKIPPPYDRIIALFSYQSPIDSFITALKFNAQLSHARLFGKLLAKQLCIFYQDKKLPEYIFPVPLHQKRLQERGFNQALEIALPIAKQFNIPINSTACIRQRATESQTLIHATKRRKNLRNAFKVIKPVQAQHIAIIDDVVTTGSTISEFSLQLRNMGVQEIDTWCCARTVKNIGPSIY